MPRTTRDEKPPAEPPPTAALDESFDQSLEALSFSERPSHDPLDVASGARFDARTEADLLALMAQQRSDPMTARDAWAEMYCRHARYVSAVASRVFGNPCRDAHVVADVVSDTFQCMFDWAGRQSPSDDVAMRFHAPDREGVRRQVLGWLAVIAGRLARHHIATRGREPRTVLDGEMDSRPEDGDDAEPPLSGLRTLLDSAMEKLRPEELEALRVSLPWYDPSTGEFAFPRGEAARTAASLGLAPDALRQRRCRSLKRLHSLLRDSSET